MQRFLSTFQRMASRYAVVSFKSLALWRIAVGITCTHAVLRRWSMLELFYGAESAYPVEAVADRPHWFLGPLHWVSSEPALHAIFALCFLVALAFTLGLWTRWVKWLLLPVLLTINLRLPLLMTGGELVLHLHALYGCFFPLGAAYSLDAWLKARKGSGLDEGAPTALQTPAYPLVLLQLSVIYLFSALAKTGPTWQAGTAVARALGAATLVTDFGAWVAGAPLWVIKVLSYGTLVVEGVLPLFLLSPWLRRQAHAVAALLIVGLHAGIWASMEVGSFSQAMLCHLPLLWHPRGSEERVVLRAPPWRRWEAAIVAAFTYLLFARLGHDLILFPNRPQLPMPDLIRYGMPRLGFWQGWMMFSPDPPGRDFVVVTEAVTRAGQRFDPWRRVASGSLEPYHELPASVVRKHVYTRYENALSEDARARMHPFYTRWVLGQRLGEDPVERFDAWLMVIPTDPQWLVPAAELDTRAGVLPLPFADALPIAGMQARGVWAPERAVDRKIVPDGTHVYTPVSATMSAGCPTLTLDLGQAKNVRSVYLQADAVDRYLIEGSMDGSSFRPLGEVPSVLDRQHRSRLVVLPGEPVRLVRLRPALSRAFRHTLSEVALFDRIVEMPSIPQRQTTRKFFASLAKPTVTGIVSGSNQPTPDCPAENWREQLKQRQ